MFSLKWKCFIKYLWTIISPVFCLAEFRLYFTWILVTKSEMFSYHAESCSFFLTMTSPIECRAKKKCGRNSVRWTVNPFQSYSRVFIALINIRLVFFFLSFSLPASFTFTLCVPHNLKYSHYHDNTVSSVRISAFLRQLALCLFLS